MYRYFFTPLLLSALALAKPQTPADTSALAGLPACAQDAANAALGGSGCAANDKACICSSQPFISAITTAVTTTCIAQDVQAALIFAQSYCGAAMAAGGSSSSAAPSGGATMSSPAASASPSMTGDDDYYGASTTTVPGTITATTSISGAVNPTAMTATIMSEASMSSMMVSGVIMTTTHCTTTTTIMTTAAKTMGYNSTYTGAAMRNVGQGIMAAVVGVAGAVALI